jgi:hydroxymethylbilane synthase
VTASLVIGTRGSQLALWQATYVAERLQTLHPGLTVRLEVIITEGDRRPDQPLPEIGGKGLFTQTLEHALLNRTIDLAVHSLKDLPTAESDAFEIAAIPERGSVCDVLISREGYPLDRLPQGAVIGTGSIRRGAQLLAYRPDLQIVSVRGNVPTRLQKALDSASPYTAIVLAEAGLERLGLQNAITQILPLTVMLPAPGQGALAVQCRRGDPAVSERLHPLDHPVTRRAVTAERVFLSELGSGCRLPVAAWARIETDQFRLTTRILNPDGSNSVTEERILS